MTSFKFILPLALSLLLLPSCRKGFIGITGKGNVTEENRSISGYQNIDLRCDATIEYIQDSVFSMVVSAQSNILDVINTTVEGETLVVDFRKNVWKHKPIHLVIHSPGLQSLLLSGSGNMNVNNNLTGNTLSLRISGSGNIRVASLNVQQLNANISGSGNISMSGGTASNENFTLSGSGNINAQEVSAVTNTSKISGSGDISVQASEALQLSISGSGNIRYKGTPVINSTISGSGKIIHI